MVVVYINVAFCLDIQIHMSVLRHKAEHVVYKWNGSVYLIISPAVQIKTDLNVCLFCLPCYAGLSGHLNLRVKPTTPVAEYVSGSNLFNPCNHSHNNCLSAFKKAVFSFGVPTVTLRQPSNIPFMFLIRIPFFRRSLYILSPFCTLNKIKFASEG